MNPSPEKSKKSIYIGICCLGIDTELAITIKRALINQSNECDIRIGVACIGREDFYCKVKNEFNSYSNVGIIYASIKEAFGVGSARLLAGSLYNKEDYYLQIDSHTHFEGNWDTSLVDKLEEAIALVENEKTILTSPLGLYQYVLSEEGEEKIGYSRSILYPVWDIEKFNRLPVIKFMFPKDIHPKLDEFIKKFGFAPTPKVCCHFMFGNHFFGNNQHIDPSSIFWEDEPLQSLALIENGFTLIHPGFELPLQHFAIENNDKKHYREQFRIFEELLNINEGKIIRKIYENYERIIRSEKYRNAIKLYQEYAGVNLLTATLTEKNRPKWFCNSKTSSNIYE
jgi:hypothetical protein